MKRRHSKIRMYIDITLFIRCLAFHFSLFIWDSPLTALSLSISFRNFIISYSDLGNLNQTYGKHSNTYTLCMRQVPGGLVIILST